MEKQQTLSLIKQAMETTFLQLNDELLAIYEPRIEKLKEEVLKIVSSSSLDKKETKELLGQFEDIVSFGSPNLDVAIDNLYLISEDDN